MSKQFFYKRQIRIIGRCVDLVVCATLMMGVWCVNAANDSQASCHAMTGTLKGLFKLYPSMEMNRKDQSCLLDDEIVQVAGMYNINAPDRYINASKLHVDATEMHLAALQKVSKITARGIKLAGPLCNPLVFAVLLKQLLLVAEINEVYFNITNPLSINCLCDSIEISPNDQTRLLAKPPVKISVVDDQIELCSVLAKIYQFAQVQFLGISTSNEKLVWGRPIHWVDCFSLVLTTDYPRSCDIDALLYGCASFICKSFTIQSYTTQGLQASAQEIDKMINGGIFGHLLQTNRICELALEYLFFLYLCMVVDQGTTIRTTMDLIIQHPPFANDFVRSPYIKRGLLQLTANDARSKFTEDYLKMRLSESCIEVSSVKILVEHGLYDLNYMGEPVSVDTDCLEDFSSCIRPFVSVLNSTPPLVAFVNHPHLSLCQALYWAADQQGTDTQEARLIVSGYLYNSTESFCTSQHALEKYLITLPTILGGLPKDQAYPELALAALVVQMSNVYKTHPVPIQYVNITSVRISTSNGLKTLFSLFEHLPDTAEIVIDSCFWPALDITPPVRIKARLVCFIDCSSTIVWHFLKCCDLVNEDVGIYLSGDYDSWVATASNNHGVLDRVKNQVYWEYSNYIQSQNFARQWRDLSDSTELIRLWINTKQTTFRFSITFLVSFLRMCDEAQMSGLVPKVVDHLRPFMRFCFRRLEVYISDSFSELLNQDLARLVATPKECISPPPTISCKLMWAPSLKWNPNASNDPISLSIDEYSPKYLIPYSLLTQLVTPILRWLRTRFPGLNWLDVRSTKHFNHADFMGLFAVTKNTLIINHPSEHIGNEGLGMAMIAGSQTSITMYACNYSLDSCLNNKTWSDSLYPYCLSLSLCNLIQAKDLQAIACLNARDRQTVQKLKDLSEHTILWGRCSICNKPYQPATPTTTASLNGPCVLFVAIDRAICAHCILDFKRLPGMLYTQPITKHDLGQKEDVAVKYTSSANPATITDTFSLPPTMPLEHIFLISSQHTLKEIILETYNMLPVEEVEKFSGREQDPQVIELTQTFQTILSLNA
ncbi:hypothetical protein NEHOM01_2457 [Nematocida homosporus]|uniref:uncharacterized protein n=1 Tax=Nematocida homosporus TaxID=1912981 RepID=UPI00221ED803|nr:uncharacterized protein NEHOM01_2457 [Nematocida homosporus]KAI5187938.1 hypothetical protein NEHOM01_2457 [Nematocida homosporus]